MVGDKQGPGKLPRFTAAAGFFTTAQRSRTMARIKGKDTKPEIKLRKALWAMGVRYRKHLGGLPGKPDLLISKAKLVIFIDGTFWHGHDWAKKKLSLKSNQAFWIAKIERNMQRDAQNNLKLQGMGYTVMRFWDKDVNQHLEKCTNQVKLYLEALNNTGIPENH